MHSILTSKTFSKSQLHFGYNIVHVFKIILICLSYFVNLFYMPQVRITVTFFKKILAVLQPAPYISFFFKLYLKPREGHRGTTQLILQARSSET